MVENSIKYLNDLNQEIEELEESLKSLEQEIKHLSARKNAKKSLTDQLIDNYIKED
jgi:archaellum component FlaC